MCLGGEQIRFSPWGPELDVGTKVVTGHILGIPGSSCQGCRSGVYGSAIVCLSVQPVSMSPAGASVHVPSVNLLESIA